MTDPLADQTTGVPSVTALRAALVQLADDELTEGNGGEPAIVGWGVTALAERLAEILAVRAVSDDVECWQRIESARRRAVLELSSALGVKPFTLRWELLVDRARHLRRRVAELEEPLSSGFSTAEAPSLSVRGTQPDPEESP